MDPNNINTIDKILLYLIKGFIFLLPLFFLPIGLRTGMDSMDKQYLLWIIVPLLCFLYLFNAFKKNKFKIRFGFLDWPLLIFVLITGVATIFSLDWFSSVFGSFSNPTVPLLTAVCLALWYWLLVQIIIDRNKLIGVIRFVLYGYSAVLAGALLVITGIIDEKGTMASFFRLSQGSSENLALLISVLAVFIYGLIGATYNRKAVYLKIIFFLSFILLVALNFMPAWFLFTAGLLIIWLVPKFYKINMRKKRLSSIVGLIAMGIVIFLLISNHYLVYDKTVPEVRSYQKLQLDQANTARLALSELGTRSAIGTGPDTFQYAYSLFRDQKMNAGEFWALRFNKSYSYIFEIIITTGIFGFLSYLIILITIFILFHKNLIYFSKLDGEENRVLQSIGLSLTAVIASLIIAQFLYSTNINLLFLFWLFIALMVGVRFVIKKEDVKEKFLIRDRAPRAFLLLGVIYFLVVFSYVALLSLSIKYLVADIKFAQAESGVNSEENYKIASRLNPFRSQYMIKLAKLNILEALDKINLPEKEINKIEIEEKINKSIKWANQAVLTSPNYVATHETLGMIYRRIIPFSEGSVSKAAEAFKSAIKLEPSNPVLYTELAETYIDDESYSEAVFTYKKALSLKPDYFRARFGLAKAYIEAGENDEALNILNALTEDYPTAEILYQKGRAYFNKGSVEEAISSFRTVLSLSPNHANALYSLALALEEEAEIEQALYYYKKVESLNPANIEVIERIRNLEEVEE